MSSRTIHCFEEPLAFAYEPRAGSVPRASPSLSLSPSSSPTSTPYGSLPRAVSLNTRGDNVVCTIPVSAGNDATRRHYVQGKSRELAMLIHPTTPIQTRADTPYQLNETSRNYWQHAIRVLVSKFVSITVSCFILSSVRSFESQINQWRFTAAFIYGGINRLFYI